MNRSGSLPNHENLTLYDRLPHQGLCEARRGRELFWILLTNPPRGAPSVAAIIVSEGESGSNSRIISEYHDFHGKCSITSEMLAGASPPPLWLPWCDNPRTGNTASSLSAGAVWGDRHDPLCHRTSALYFISWQKELPWKTHGYSSSLPESMTHVRFYRAQIIPFFLYRVILKSNTLIFILIG